MLRAFGRLLNSLRAAAELAARADRALMGLAGALLLTGALASAQAPDSLPSATEPQGPPVQLFAQVGPALLTADTQRGGIGKRSTDMSPVGHEPNDAPVVSMAPHSEDSLWWISGQANIIIQGDLPFHSPYEGTNSFLGRGEYKTSMVGTLYTALRPNHSIRYSTDFIFDLEAAEGRGLSEAFGLGGFTNLDVVRNPTWAGCLTSRATRFTRSSVSPTRPPASSRDSLPSPPACPCAASSSA
ncbi:MAG TPA: hypothetical protein VN776_16625 [Terracidiphilus sp.]|nr:hypothetical protein [Terracidiphilus sp.]